MHRIRLLLRENGGLCSMHYWRPADYTAIRVTACISPPDHRVEIVCRRCGRLPFFMCEPCVEDLLAFFNPSAPDPYEIRCRSVDKQHEVVVIASIEPLNAVSEEGASEYAPRA
jgi:hypothetical protein